MTWTPCGPAVCFLVSDDYRILTEYGLEDYSYTLGEDGSYNAIKDAEESDAQQLAAGCALWTNASILPVRAEVRPRLGH